MALVWWYYGYSMINNWNHGTQHSLNRLFVPPTITGGHGTQRAVLASLEGFGVVVGTAEEIRLPVLLRTKWEQVGSSKAELGDFWRWFWRFLMELEWFFDGTLVDFHGRLIDFDGSFMVFIWIWYRFWQWFHGIPKEKWNKWFDFWDRSFSKHFCEQEWWFHGMLKLILLFQVI